MGETSAKVAETLPARDAAEPAVPRLGQSLLERIGNTPLLRFDSLTAHLPGVTLLGKAEWYNPGGSVKDRAASSIVAEGRRNGQFAPGKILLDATSGNTGIAYAMLGAAEGFSVTLISIPTTRIGGRIITARQMKSGNKPKDGSPTSLPCSAPAVRSWVPHAAS